jgi:hypothetical protein
MESFYQKTVCRLELIEIDVVVLPVRDFPQHYLVVLFLLSSLQLPLFKITPISLNDILTSFAISRMVLP